MTNNHLVFSSDCVVSQFDVVTELKKYFLNVSEENVRGVLMTVADVEKEDIVEVYLPYIHYYYGFGASRKFGLRIKSGDELIPLSKAGLVCMMYKKGRVKQTEPKKLVTEVVFNTSVVLAMEKKDETYMYYRSIPVSSYFGVPLDESNLFHTLKSEPFICKFVPIDADDYFNSFMDIMAGIGPYGGKLQDDSTYEKDPKIYFKEMQRNYDDAKKLLRGIGRELYPILSYGDGPGIMLMAAVSLGIPLSNVRAYDPYLADYSIFPVFKDKRLPFSLFKLVVCCHSYSFCATELVNCKDILVYDRSTPHLIDKMNGLNRQWTCIRPFLFTTESCMYKLMRSFNNILLSVERDRGPLGNTVYNCLMPSYEDKIKNMNMSYVTISTSRESPVLLDVDNTLCVFTFAYYAHGNIVGTRSSSNTFHFCSFPNAFKISGENQLVVCRFNTRLAVFWSDELIPGISHYVVSPFTRIEQNGTLSKGYVYFIGLHQSFSFLYRHNIVYFLYAYSEMSSTLKYFPSVFPCAVCPLYIASKGVPYNELSKFIKRHREAAQLYHDRMDCKNEFLLET
jgi:hypothetical protein